MAEAPVTIRNLHIRVPGIGREEGRRLGEAVARQIAGRPLQPAKSLEIGALRLRVRAGSGSSTAQLAAAIVDSIHGSLR